MKILAVDDEIDVKTLFEQKFRREIRSGEMEFSFANSGEEALDFMKMHESDAVIILSDINMPGMTGIELLRRIRSDHPAPPPIVIIITAYGDEDNIQQASRFGANDFLNKPIDFVELKEKLKNIQ